MEYAELTKELKALIVDKLRLEEVAPEEIKDDQPLFGAGLGLDSVDALELAMHVEQKYKIRISDEALAKEAFQSVGALASFILKSRNA
jgi:acyl carrier protein